MTTSEAIIKAVDNLEAAFRMFSEEIGPGSRVNNTKTALRFLSEAFGKSFAEIDFQHLTIAEEILHAYLLKDGVVKNSSKFRNAMNNLRYFLTWMIRKKMIPSKKRIVLPEWLELERRVKGKYKDRSYLCALAHLSEWCSEQGIIPASLNSELVLKHGLKLLEENSNTGKNKYTRLKKALRDLMEDGEIKKIDLPHLGEVREPYAIRRHLWPESIKEGYSQYVNHVSASYVFGNYKTESLQRQTTIDGDLLRIELYLGWLKNKAGVDISTLSFEDVFTKERMLAHLLWLNKKDGGEITRSQQKMVGIFKTICLKYFKMQGPEKEFLDSLRVKITKRKKTNNRATIEELLTVAEKMKENFKKAKKMKRKATRLRDYLMISLLIRRPLRSRNIIEMELLSNLVKENDEWILRFQGLQVKASNIEKPFPRALVEDLEEYIEKYRPALTQKDDVKYVFLSERGQQLSYDSFYKIIDKHTMQYLGKRINPHAFRHNAVTEVLKKMPMDKDNKLLIGKNLLDHADIRTTAKFYADIEEREQIEQYDKFVEGQKGKAIEEGSLEEQNERLLARIGELEMELKKIKGGSDEH